MPNHITNELNAAPRVLDHLRSDSIEVDFNKVIPMPELIKLPEGVDGIRSDAIDWALMAVGAVPFASLFVRTPDPAQAFKRGDYGAAVLRLEQSNRLRLLMEGPFPKDYDEQTFELFIRCIRCQKLYGRPTWYEWSIANWGTKWNAYDAERVRPDMVRFRTAWSTPTSVVKALSLAFPTESIGLRWADEDFGRNVGAVTVVNGAAIDGGALANGSVAAEELAVEILHGGVLREDMVRLQDGHIAYREEEEVS